MSNDEEFEDAVDRLDVPEPDPESGSGSQKLNKFGKIKLKKLTLKKSPVRDSPPTPVELDNGSSGVPLGVALGEARRAIDLFLNNDFAGSKNICEPLVDKSIYHALGYSIFMFLEAVMTFEQDRIEAAMEVLGQTCETIASYRKKNGGLVDSLGRLVKSRTAVDYNQYTEMEMHAELCYGEVLLLRAILTLCEDENLVAFVKAGLRVRSCFQSFKECWLILLHRDWKDAQHKKDFESGVRVGVGAFNLMISLLPARIMRLLEFIGFNASRDGQDTGLADLKRVYDEKMGLRQFLSALSLLGYEMFITYFLANKKIDLDLCGNILNDKLEQYPNGIFFLFFKGRFHLIQGQLDEAKQWYKRACSSEWPQFHHICYWELIWCHQFGCDWWPAMEYADLLLKESKWSKTFYAYLKAALMCMVQGSLSPEQQEEQIELMTNVPTWKQRIAGKSIPMEKFAVSKAKRFLDQDNRLVLPIFEIIYLWNGFAIIGNNFQTIEPFYLLIEEQLKEHQMEPDHKYKNDNYCLLMLLKGLCFKCMRSPLQAQECFQQILKFTGKLKGDKYLIPYAMYEYSLLIRDEGQLETALSLLDKAKEFKEYQLQSRLHFRIHAAQSIIKSRLKAGNVTESSKTDDEAGEFLDAEEDIGEEIVLLKESSNGGNLFESITGLDVEKVLESKNSK